MRKEKNRYFMEIAFKVSERSTCIKRKVGAILVDNNRIIATGYNGAPTKFPHCTKKTCLRINIESGKNEELCRGVHAEMNCIIQCAKHGVQIGMNTILYSTDFPCINCLKALINAGIRKIYYINEYENLLREYFIENSGTKVIKLNLE
ncbi:MAG: deoxycytidylate deaminase [Promethearchaeota archaeon]